MLLLLEIIYCALLRIYFPRQMIFCSILLFICYISCATRNPIDVVYDEKSIKD